MRLKTTLILLLATIGIGAYISLYDIRQPSHDERERLSKHLLDIEPEHATQLVLKLPQAQVTLTRRGNAWTLSPNGVRANEELVKRILSHLSPLVSHRRLVGSTEHPLDVASFGLNPPGGVVSVVAQGHPTTLLIGGTTPVQEHRYVQVQGQPAVFVVSAELFDDANQPSDQFRDPRLLRVDPWTTEELIVSSSDAGGLALARRDQTWHLTRPLEDAADRSEVNLLLNSLMDITIKRFVDDAPQVEQLSTWGFDHPKAELTLVQEGPPRRSIMVFFGTPLPDDASLLYAKRSDEAPLYAIAAKDVDTLLRDPQGLRLKSCFEFFLTDVTKLAVMREGTRWTIERKGGNWEEADTHTVLDAQRVEGFLNDLADLRLSGFVDEAPTDLARYGLQPPNGTLTVWTTNRDTPQRLAIGATIEQTGSGAPRAEPVAPALTPVGRNPERAHGQRPWRESKGRYGRIEGRAAVVRLPDLVTTLLARTPDQLRPSSAQPSTPGSTTSSPQSAAATASQGLHPAGRKQ